MQHAGDGTITRTCGNSEFKKTKTWAKKAANNFRGKHAFCLESSEVPCNVAALRQIRRIVAFGFKTFMCVGMLGAKLGSRVLITSADLLPPTAVFGPLLLGLARPPHREAHRQI